MTGLEPSSTLQRFAKAYIRLGQGQAKNFLNRSETLVYSGLAGFVLAPKDCGRGCG